MTRYEFKDCFDEYEFAAFQNGRRGNGSNYLFDEILIKSTSQEKEYTHEYCFKTSANYDIFFFS